MIGELCMIGLPDGRQAEVLTAGPADGRVLVVHDGTPSGPVALRSMVEDAPARGLRTVQPARPGYGRSDPRPGRRVADVAEDVAAVLDSLGAEQFITAGWSGGAPHALACAALLPGRCVAAASMAGVAPYPAAGLDWLAGMGEENVTEFGTAMAGEARLAVYLGSEVGHLASIGADAVAEDLGGLASEADMAVITGEFAEYLAASFRAGVSQGAAGWQADDLAFVTGWGFTPAEVGAGAPVAVWQGDQDRMVPAGHGRWLAEHIPGARPHLLPGQGHLTLVLTSFGQILDDLLDMAGWPTS